MGALFSCIVRVLDRAPKSDILTKGKDFRKPGMGGKHETECMGCSLHSRSVGRADRLGSGSGNLCQSNFFDQSVSACDFTTNDRYSNINGDLSDAAANLDPHRVLYPHAQTDLDPVPHRDASGLAKITPILFYA